MQRIRYYLTLLLLNIAAASPGQNLVPNASFENFIKCPEDDTITLKDWMLPTQGDANNFHTCGAVEQGFSAPKNDFGFMHPRTGEGYAGIHLFSHTSEYDHEPFREYLQVKLTKALEAGKTYDFMCYVSLADAYFATDRLEVYFSNKEIHEDTQGVLPFIPQIKNAGTFITDKDNWTKYAGTYTAIGGEQYLLIGNFDTDANTPIAYLDNDQTTLVIKKNTLGARSYYYIDDVSLYECGSLAELGSDTTICDNETLVLDATTEGATYRWQDGSTAPTFAVHAEGLYRVDVYKDGCHSRDSVYVRTKAPRFSLGDDFTLCRGQTLTLKAPGAGPPFRWSDGSEGAALAVDRSGTYWLTARVNGCQSTDTIKVTFEEPLRVVLGSDTALCYGQVLRLEAFFPGATYLWNDHSTASVLEARESGQYSVQVKGAACENGAAIHVTFHDCPEDIPNLITPNGDDKNETFVVKEIRNDRWAIEILNRWGENVYRSSDYHNEWDAGGRPAGVYYYHLKNLGSKRTYKGWIHVMK